jgi:uncharacterized protein (TIGR03089 family)
MFSDVGALLRTLLAEDLGRPRLTWYGAGGERVELSAKVLDNWVAKTANLLVDELDAGSSSTVAVRLPVHWRAAVWLLAAWSCGAATVDDPAAADVVVTASPQSLPPVRGEVVAVALPALAPTFGAGLPDGVLDGNAEVRTRGDVFLPYSPPDPTTHADLFAAAATAVSTHGWQRGVRLLVPTSVPAAPAEWLLGPLICLGSVVLLDADAIDLDVERIAAQEGITARLG